MSRRTKQIRRASVMALVLLSLALTSCDVIPSFSVDYGYPFAGTYYTVKTLETGETTNAVDSLVMFGDTGSWWVKEAFSSDGQSYAMTSGTYSVSVWSSLQLDKASGHIAIDRNVTVATVTDGEVTSEVSSSLDNVLLDFTFNWQADGTTGSRTLYLGNSDGSYDLYWYNFAE